VNAALPKEALATYKSKSQQVRVATESWASENLYCPNCDEPHLAAHPANTRAVDFQCPECSSPFQLKAQSHELAGRIVDAAYSAMVLAIRENRTPNLFAIHYDRDEWRVRSLILIPHFAFPLSAIEKRKPLARTARRAGWVGCNILLGAIPPDARISVISNGVPAPPRQVRERYGRLRPLEKLSVEKRGWTLDVLNAVHSIGKKEFDLADVYAHDHALARLHPGNRHIRDKIRQQLQVLRDAGFLHFLGAGSYRLP
jgi:type II restriction enzyme